MKRYLQKGSFKTKKETNVLKSYRKKKKRIKSPDKIGTFDIKSSGTLSILAHFFVNKFTLEAMW